MEKTADEKTADFLKWVSIIFGIIVIIIGLIGIICWVCNSVF